MLIQKNIPTEKAMLALGQRLADYCQAGEVIYLMGELGAGKTTFVRGLLRGFGYKGFVKSPSYTLIEVYSLETLEVVHVDLYRLSEANEYWDIGLTDYLKKDSILLIEWPEKAEKLLPPPSVCIHFDIQLNNRLVNITSDSPRLKNISI
ncbi:tRNA (adenosine(37)-N6)-threonylcarbamoyltransferase complex ATPase subunit type 1 TsaE [Coxiella burnetii]|uniref:tRNA threonylcarbamoyladenosine biosynthesis protein TsaE n=1 Tax=Coxiella burnetii (strain Dugway 5J108-111) TaxID=434922 RepID=A9KE35_COXBN|nr:tRNA (adenosine(37)-N6)-threonylcarbamoyltransferase complex ATPase subunit type 1 TsaE [Coxiella burnetii]ABS77308.1 ATP/GTP hydrolase [Coxiella burnetii Dugway 5J108-111]OYK80126.1 tRNA (adenosine(37)-N6)-threonylcarbamoyltransferase complex ATPase subunit type 1 TsaE [Coxiella burnetii]OYK82208.1 tRNA (adenosine(37)-N6)-threonylcarbamoyltransferase complex ATPase subunit type 1 TsaE [Coxiella burnetii]